VLYREETGFTQARRSSEIQGIQEFINTGALLGHLWAEGYFAIDDPPLRTSENLRKLKGVR
jgi:hypothetical protein